MSIIAPDGDSFSIWFLFLKTITYMFFILSQSKQSTDNKYKEKCVLTTCHFFI